MNREIKFRFYDKDNNEMFYQGKDFKDINTVDGVLKPFLKCDNEWDWYKRNYDIMQYTGLKDKNGKEIYDGDIVRCRVNDNSIKGEEAYVLDKDGFGLEHVKKTVNYKIEFWNSNYNYGYRVKNGKTNFMITQGTLLNIEAEVIGNIYENPELLEEKQ